MRAGQGGVLGFGWGEVEGLCGGCMSMCTYGT